MPLKRALFIGRFQPFHKGHLDALAQIWAHPEAFREIIIAIGSAENDFLPENPLTAGERMEMIAAALDESGLSREKIWLLPVRDINRYALWPQHVLSLCPEFQAVFSCSPLVQHLWREHTAKKVYSLEKNQAVSATRVREKMKNNENVGDLIPQSVQSYLEKIKFAERLRKIDT